MNREVLQESLSAAMDNEADELELRRVLAASDDPQIRATWSRYQMVRAAMHKELLEPRLDIAAAVSAALAEEPVVVEAAATKTVRKSWRGVGRLAVAASVTVAVLAGVRLYNQDDVAGMQLAEQLPQSTLETPAVQGPAILASFSPGAAQTLQSPVLDNADQAEVVGYEQLPDYLRQPAPQAQASGADSEQPFARAAVLENR
ncbi:MAG: sigma-E factor negative regulatory protein [Pseudomonas sp.]